MIAIYDYNAKITNIVDGDTFDLDIDLGFHIHIHERVRVLELDTPEKRGDKERELGWAVTDFARKVFFGQDAVIYSKRELTPKTDSFGRWLVDIVMKTGEYSGQSVSEIYTKLGVNKLAENYSEENVKRINEI